MAFMRDYAHFAKVYGRFLLLHLRVQVEYEADFWLGILGMGMLQAANFTLVWALFTQTPSLGGWSLWEIALLYGLLIIPRGLTDLFCHGVWSLPLQAYFGVLDVVLVRPMPRILQVFASKSSIHGFAHLIMGALLIVNASEHLHIHWSLSRAALLVFILANSLLVTVGMLTASATSVFWTKAGGNGLTGAIHGMADAAQVPLDIYGRGVRAILTYVLPFAFVSYFPACLLLDRTIEPHLALWLFPFSGLAVATLAAYLWRRGLVAYESPGH